LRGPLIRQDISIICIIVPPLKVIFVLLCMVSTMMLLYTWKNNKRNY